ncbi:MAG: hypothetical protein HC906_14235 [Bacteroidales bacterium]|nr:hypothetical protein [Bacteroidales bacterium]
MKKIFVTLFATVSLTLALNAQTDENIVINHEMINRFNAVETAGEYLSWGNMVMAFDNQSLQELYLAYINSDLETQTLAEIKSELENKINGHLNIYYISDGELAWYNQVKREISNKLSLSDDNMP